MNTRVMESPGLITSSIPINQSMYGRVTRMEEDRSYFKIPFKFLKVTLQEKMPYRKDSG